MFVIVALLFIITLVITLGYRKIAINNKIFAIKNHRTLHSFSIPKGGGIVFSILFVISIFFILWNWQLADEIVWIVGVGGLVATLFGFLDDIINIRARVKLIVQLLLSGWTVYWLYVSNLLLLDWVPIFVIIIALLFFMVWMMNAYNFMDGVDGMAASGAIFSSSTLALMLFLTNSSSELIPVFILIATTVSGFIVFNWPPATIFMGDAGSIFLGYIFGSLLLVTVLNGELSIWSWLTVFGYFFADTTVTQIARVVLVKQWYLAHRSHAYQNLARVTNSHLKVTGGVTLYNLVWVLPLILWSALQPEMGMITATLSIAPAMAITYKYGPLLSSS
jgi:Fuc2NAc and GlcNAc transferase